MKYTITEQPEHLVRLWSDDLESVDFNAAGELVLEDGIPGIGNSVFVPGDEYAMDLDQSRLLAAFPYIDRKGRFTRSVWALLN